MLVPGKPFQPNVMFVDKAKLGPKPKVDHMIVLAPALPANIKVGRKGLPGGKHSSLSETVINCGHFNILGFGCQST